MAGSCAGHRVLASLLTAISRFDALRLRFDKPFDGLRVVSVVEPLKALSPSKGKIEDGRWKMEKAGWISGAYSDRVSSKPSLRCRRHHSL